MKEPDEQTFYRQLGGRIRELRGKLSQEQLALKVRLTRTSIVNIERGRQKLLVHNLFRIAKALNVRPSVLLQPLEPQPADELALSVAESTPAPAAGWIQRSLSKAMKSLPSNDTP